MKLLATAVFVCAVAPAALLLSLASAEAAPSKIMVFDFYLDNTSLEPTTSAETERLKKISDELRADLQKSGQYEAVPGPTLESSSVQTLGKCSDAEIAAAKKAGDSEVACPWVQKVSNLILNLNIVIEDLKAGQIVKGGSVDIRGNTDESWDHGLKFLLQEHVFPKP
jgi:hypothetical protein